MLQLNSPSEQTEAAGKRWRGTVQNTTKHKTESAKTKTASRRYDSNWKKMPPGGTKKAPLACNPASSANCF